MKRLHFEAVIEIIGINPYVLVTADQAHSLHANWKKPMPVLVQVNGEPIEPWRINMMPMGSKGNGDFYLYLHGDVRKASQTKVGDTVTVDVQFDEAYRDGPALYMPDWFQLVLSQNPSAQTGWERLTPSRQKEIARYLSSLKSTDAQQRNLQKVLHVLDGNKAHFMGRDWQDGR